MKFVYVFVVLASALVGQTAKHSVYGRYNGPHSLGPYRLQYDVSMKSLLSLFGVKPTGRETYCFADPGSGLYLYVQGDDEHPGRVSDILLSSFPNCKRIPVVKATIDPNVWKTSDGIGIGSTKEEVLRTYHSPVAVQQPEKSGRGVIAGNYDIRTNHAPVGDSSFLYSCLLSAKQGCDNDLRVAMMGFSADKLIWIRVSNSE